MSDAGAVLDLFLYFEEEVLRGGALPLPYFWIVIPGMLCYNVLADKLEYVEQTETAALCVGGCTISAN